MFNYLADFLCHRGVAQRRAVDPEQVGDLADVGEARAVVIPAAATSATLTFALHIETVESGTTAYDKLVVTVKNSSGTVLGTAVFLGAAVYLTATSFGGHLQ